MIYYPFYCHAEETLKVMLLCFTLLALGTYTRLVAIYLLFAILIANNMNDLNKKLGVIGVAVELSSIFGFACGNFYFW